MTEVELVTETSKANNQEIAFQPGRSIEHLTIRQALDIYEKRGETPLPIAPSEEAEKISSYLKEIDETIEKSPANVKVKEI